MFPTDLYPTLSRYNRWMNEKLFIVCAQLSDAERKRDVAAPFRSIHGTWNHLLLTDRIWLGRFNETTFDFASLSDELYADFDELRRERARTDEALDEFVASLTSEKLNETFHFISSDARQYTIPFWVCVQHLFNHQTHHRGQMTTLLEQFGVDCGVTDLPKMPGLMAN